IANLALQGGSGEGYGSLPTDLGLLKEQKKEGKGVQEDEVLVKAFGGLGDCGVVIGDGVLAMGEFDGEAIEHLWMSLKRPLLYERRLKMKGSLNEDEDELDI
nr:hypothetical protein [Tanacetum cinerariifolium]